MLVLIADDHSLVRQGLIILMRDAHPDWAFAEADSFDKALDQLAAAPVDLLLIDLHMPGMDGGRTLQALREVYPQSRIAVLTGTEDRETILECLAAGVNGYIPKSDTADKMLRAIDLLLAGGVYVPPTITRVSGGATRQGEPAPARLPGDAAAPAASPPGGQAGKPAGLTRRQLDVVKLLADGRSTKDIARQLNLGVGTVKVHLAGIYRALGATNRMEAVVRAGRLKPED